MMTERDNLLFSLHARVMWTIVIDFRDSGLRNKVYMFHFETDTIIPTLLPFLIGIFRFLFLEISMSSAEEH